MIITNNNRNLPAVVCSGIVVLAVCICSVIPLQAQDFESIKRKLDKAVKAGELTSEQADRMMAALEQPNNKSVQKQAVAKDAKERPKTMKARKQHSDASTKENDEHQNGMEARIRHFKKAADHIEAAVKAGKLSEEEAKKKLTALREELIGDTDQQASSDEDENQSGMAARKRYFNKAADRIEAAVKAGKLTEEEAKKKLTALREELIGDTDQQASSDEDENQTGMAARKRYFNKAADRIEAAVKAGKLTEEEAKKKLTALREELIGDTDQQASSDEDENQSGMAARKRYFNKAADRIEAAVKAGKLTEEEAKKKLTALREELIGDTDQQASSDEDENQSGMAARKRYFNEYAAEIKADAKAGKLTEEEAEKKIKALREELVGDTDQQASSDEDENQSGMAARKRYFNKYAAEIKADAKAGKLTEEEAEKKIKALREELVGDTEPQASSDEEENQSGMAARKRYFNKYAAEIKADVKAGKLTEKEAEKKIEALREELVGDTEPQASSDEEENQSGMAARKRYFKKYAAEIKADVKAGKLTEKEAEKKIEALREELIGDTDQQASSDEDENQSGMAARKRYFNKYAAEIKANVNAGKLTEEEAEKKIKALREELVGDTDQQASSDEEENQSGMAARKRYFNKYAAEIKADAKAGKLTEEEAEKKLQKLREEIIGETAEQKKSRAANAKAETKEDAKKKGEKAKSKD